MLTQFAVSNFKNLARLPANGEGGVPFGPLNVLIGPNGCGKSSLLQAIDFLRAFFETSIEVYLKDRGWDYRDLPNLRQTTKSIRWQLTADLGPNTEGSGAGRYEYTVTLQPRKHLGVGEEHLFVTRSPGAARERLLERRGRDCTYVDRQTGREEHREVLSLPASLMSRWDMQSDRRRFPEALRFRGWIEQFRSYLIWDPKVLRYPDRGRHDEIGLSGEHLAAVIGRLRDRHPGRFDSLVKRLRRLFPTVTNISVAGRGWGWRTIRLHEGNGKEVVFNSQQMSDGVLRLLAIASFLYADSVPSLIALEEPENGVHPQIVREVVQILRELTQRKAPHACQVFFTTHSPYVLDEFFDHPEQVYCMDRATPQSGARLVRLSANKDLHLAREAFPQSLGEAWLSGLIGATAGARLS